jgi:hypothetical protein
MEEIHLEKLTVAQLTHKLISYKAVLMEKLKYA